MKVSSNLITCGRCLAPTVWNIKSIPNYYRLYFVEGGEAFFTVGGKEFKLKKDHFYFFPSTLPFLIRQNNDDRLNHLNYNFFIDPPVVATEPLCASIDEHPSFRLFLSLMTDTVEAFNKTNAAPEKDVACHCLEAFLSLFFTVTPIFEHYDSTIVQAIEYMEANYRENITIKDIARRLYLSEDYFIRKFKKAMNMTPYTYLVHLRTSVARVLITSGATLESAAEDCGYKSASSLSHALSKYSD